MSLILNIDTSTEKASLCIAHDGISIAYLENVKQKDHAAWMHPAIKELLQQASSSIHDLDAVAVTAGPGSYTGLRVGMATAKGLCYSLNIPLITENTLRIMALATKQHQNAQFLKQDYYLCPMIDARRMEVFTGLFNSDLLEVVNSFALELSPDSFSDYLETHEIFFSGSGSIKFQQVSRHEHATFLQVDHSAIHLAELSSVKFSNGNFSDVAYTEPLYLKEFYTTSKK